MLQNTLLNVHNDRSLSQNVLFEHTFTSSIVGMALLSTDGYLLKVNPTLCAIFGYPEQKLLNVPLQSLAHPNEWQDNAGLIQELTHSNLPHVQVKKHYRHKLGHYVTCKLTSSVIKIDNGSEELYLLQFEDISGQKNESGSRNKEQWEQKQLKRMQVVFENSTEGLFFTDVLDDNRFKIVEINPAFTAMSGVTEEAINHPFDESQDPGDGSLLFILGKFRKVVATKKIVEFEIEYNKNITLTKYVPVLDNNGNVAHIIGISALITQQKTYEHELFVREQEFRTLVENSPDIISRFNLDFTRVYANPAFTKLTGFSHKEAKQLVNPQTQLQANIAYKLKNTLTQVKETALPLETELAWNDAQNNYYCYQVNAIPEFENNGQLVSILVIGRDITERKKMEEALRKSEEQYRLIAENTADVITLYDLNFKPLYISPSIQKLLGFTVEEAMERSVEQIFTPESLQFVQKKLAEQMILENDKDVDLTRTTCLELEEYCNDGSTVWVEISATFLRDSNFKPIGFTGVTRNVTERRRMEQELARREREYRSLLNNSPENIIRYNKKGKTIYTSLAKLQKFKFSSNLIGNTPLEAIKNVQSKVSEYVLAETTRYHDTLMNVLSTGIAETVEMTVITEDGTHLIHSVIITPEKNENNNVIGALSFGRDITKRTIAEKALSESEKKFRDIFNLSTDSILIFDHQYNVLEANQTALDLMNITLEKIKNSNIIDFVSKEDISLMQERQRKILLGEKVPQGEIQLIRPNSKLIPVELNSKLINYKNDRAILTIMRDIADRKDMQNKLYMARVESEEGERGRYAKELHDGLGPILSTCKIYVHSLKIQENHKQREEYIIRVGELLEDALRGIREISNNLSPHILKNFGLPQAVKSFVDKLVKVTSVKFNIRSNVEERLPEITEFTLYRTLTELINNSIKHAEAALIEIDMHLNNKTLKIDYNDNGKGFDYHDKINSGNGFGLLNIENRIRQINGKCQFYSSADNGTKVKIVINL